MSNLVPEGWKGSKVGDSCFVTKLAGYEYTSHFDYSIGGEIIAVRVLNLKKGKLDLSQVQTIPRATSDALPRSKLAKNDLVISYVGTVGEVAFIDEDDRYHLAPNVAKITPDENEIDGKFLAHVFTSDDTQKSIKLLGSVTSQPSLSMENLRKVFVPLPPLPEQKKIAAILTSVDEVIEKTQAQIDKLKDLKTGMMQELLTRGVGVDGKPHTEFKDSPVGRIPKGWEVRYIADCCSKMTNGYVGSTRDIYVEKGVDYILCQNVRRNVFVEKTYKYVRQEFHQKNIRACLQEGDVLTVQTGAGNGDTCVVPKSYEGANCHALIISRPKKEILNPYFLAEYMNSDQGKQRVSVIATGGAHPHLNTTDLRREVIPLPPIEEQNQMVNSIRAVQKKYLLLEAKKKKFEGSKKALMQDLLTGKVRVKVDS
ncbi:restriction endonuclease subunit S [Vibrio tapetis subsp. quintayensis]|uniref:restriction endonuclease subunit S n=1 Tax=Vibrio tapetis TaxID=52443 RepID=UPI0025B3A18C|nr:restriction endonuclease subunit S [Vibrio tapetis]MDN3680085.1 restriction endonuclease subunit S [Vibrio tapetis subsp. quintayensis]